MTISKLFDTVSAPSNLCRSSIVNGATCDIMRHFEEIRQNAITCGHAVKIDHDLAFTVESETEYMTVLCNVFGDSATLTATNRKY